MKKIILLFSMLLTVTFAFGQHTFTGEGDGTSWDDPANWSQQIVPLTIGYTNVTTNIPDGFNVSIDENLSLSMTGGTLNGPGTVTNHGNFIIDNSAVKYFSNFLQFVNEGEVQLGTGTDYSTTYDLRIHNNSLLKNTEDGIIISNGLGIDYTGSRSYITFENEGLFQKQGESNEQIAVRMKNTGTLKVLEGTLKSSASNSVLEGGVYNVSEEALFEMTTNHHISGELTGTIDGIFEISSAITVESEQTMTNNLNGNGIYFSSGSLYGPGTLTNNKLFRVDNNAIKYLQDTLTFINNDTLKLGTGTDLTSTYDLRISNNSLLKNAENGIIISDGLGIDYTTSNSNIVFINEGLLQKIGDSDEQIRARMENKGTIQVDEGKLTSSVNNSFLNGGTYIIAEEAHLNLTANHRFKGNLTGNVDGIFEISNAITVEEDDTATNNLEGNGILLSNGILNGPGTFENNKLFTADKGYTKHLQAELTFINNDTLKLGTGTDYSTTYDLRIHNSSLLKNTEDGIIISNGLGIDYATSNSNIVFINEGLLQKIGDFDEQIRARMENKGTFQVDEGKITSSVNNSFLNGGTYIIAEEAHLNLTANHQLKGALSGNVEGIFEISNAITVEEDDTVTNNLEGNGILFSSGYLNGPGTFENNKLFTADKGYTKYLQNELTFINNDTLKLGTGTDHSTTYDLRIQNSSLLKNTEDGVIISNGLGIDYTTSNSNIVFINEGLLQKIGDSDEQIRARMENAGLIQVEDGKLTMNYFDNTAEGLVKGVKVQFSSSNFNNSGTFNPGLSPGKMTVETHFGMNDGILLFDIDGPTPETEYDVLDFTATGNQLLNLTGDIQVNLNYQAEIGDSYTVLTSGRTIEADLPDYIESIYDYQYFDFEVIVNDNDIVLEVVAIEPMCPDLLEAPDNVSVVNSACEAGCSLSEGEILAPVDACPEGSQIQYSTDNGDDWSYDLPIYNPEDAMTIVTRCECEEAPEIVSPISDPVTTNPGECVTPDMPVITIVDNVCPFDGGSISADDPGQGLSVEWSLDEENWSTEVPEYTAEAITIYARTIHNLTGCVSVAAEATTNPEDCSDYCLDTPDAGIVSIDPDEGAPNSEYVVSATDYSEGIGISYQWQSNTDNEGWEDEGQESDTYADFEAIAPDDYDAVVEWRLKVTCEYAEDEAYSDPVSFTIESEPCDAPSNLIVSDVTENSAVISWEGNADQYEVYYTDGDTDSTVMTTEDSIELENLTSNTAYLVSVTPYCNGDAGEESDTVDFTTLEETPVYDCEDLELNIGDSCYDEDDHEGVVTEDCECFVEPAPCDAPTNITITNITEDSATISWEGDADEYEVYYTDSNSDYTETTSNTSIVLENLLSETYYMFTITAYCNDVEGGMGEGDFMTDELIPDYDCEEMGADFGDICWDTDGNEGVVTEDCECFVELEINCELDCIDDIEVTAEAGETSAVVNYEIGLTGENCLENYHLIHQIEPGSEIDDAIRCGSMLFTGLHARVYEADTDLNLTGIDVASWDNGQQKVSIYAYTGPVGEQYLDRSQMNLIWASPYFSVPGNNSITHYNFPETVHISSGTVYVVEQSTPENSSEWVVASTTEQQTAPSYISCSASENPENYGTWSDGYDYIHLYQVLYEGETQLEIEQTSGLASGSEFPVGTTTNCFNLLDAEGNIIDTCCFEVIVVETPVEDCEIPSSVDNNIFISTIHIDGIGIDINNDYYDLNYSSSSKAAGGYAVIDQPDFTIYPGYHGSYTVSSGPAGNSGAYYYAVWIDFNNDGCFDENEQVIWSEGAIYNGQIDNEDVPLSFETLPTGTYTARIRNSMQGWPSPHGTGDGEALDFTIHIISAQDAEHLLGIDQMVFNQFNFYPNPMQQQLNLNAGRTIEQVEIHNLLGQKVTSVRPNTLETIINTDALQAGVYMMTVKIDGRQKSFKVVKK